MISTCVRNDTLIQIKIHECILRNQKCLHFLDVYIKSYWFPFIFVFMKLHGCNLNLLFFFGIDFVLTEVPFLKRKQEKCGSECNIWLRRGWKRVRISLFGRNPTCKSLFAHSSPIFPNATCQWCQFSPTWVLCVESTLILAFTPEGVLQLLGYHPSAPACRRRALRCQ